MPRVNIVNEIRQGRDASERYKELQDAEAWTEYLLARKQQYMWQCRRNISDDEYRVHRMEYDRQWEMEWSALEHKLLNGSGVPSMVKRQLGETANIGVVKPPQPTQTPMPEYVGKKLPTIEELEKEYNVTVSDNKKKNEKEG